jgi:DNA polymerase
MDAEVVVIARNPGVEEERLGEPLVGPSGIVFSQFLDLCEIDRDRTYLTNLAQCFSPERPPTAEEYQSCSKWKEGEFALLQPKLVILLGNDVFHYFYPSRSESVLAVQGEVFDGFERPGYGSGYKVIVFPHPSYSMSRKRIAMEWGIGSTVVKAVMRRLRGH